jgi:MFS family permease
MPLLDSDLEEHPSTSVAVGSRWSKLRDGVNKLNLVLVNGMWRTTGVLLVLWLGVAWLYYGIVLLTTSLLQYNPHCSVEDWSNNTALTCKGNQLDTGDYIKILWTSAAELPGLLVTVVIIELLGRKITLAVEFLACMIGFLLLFICTSESVLTFFLFFIRACTSGLFQTVYVYTPEVYPTNTRAFGMGICTSSARIGAIVTPYVAQVLLHINDYITLSLYAGSCLILAALAMLLPIETKGRTLKDTGQ